MEEVTGIVEGKLFEFQTGYLAKQANGSILAKCGDTAVLVTAVFNEEVKEDLDFFPLTVNYLEKAFAAGKIPGGFIKREGKASDHETLVSRLIDRSIRPLFPEGFKHEVQVIATVLAMEDDNNPDVVALNGASLALCISEIPFDGPVGAVRVCKFGDTLVINPSMEDEEKADLNFVVAGREDAITMVEGEANEVSEKDVIEALKLAHEKIKEIIKIQKELIEKCGKPKIEFTPPELNKELLNEIKEKYLSKIDELIFIKEKLKRRNSLKKLKKEIQENYEEDISEIFKEIVDQRVREYIIKEGKRIDGRGVKDIRPIECKVGIFKRNHGSGLFTRGETQAFVTVTLGSGEDEQIVDSLSGEESKRFMVHYNFPPFSVGEIGFLRAPGRREIGHGYLAERALSKVIPPEEEFPYTIRVVSEILESNGSSSMATVCGGSLALMDAGVPVKSHVAGIAMGLIQEEDKFIVLSDILGDEDHLGDMDFKVAGTENGVTAVQMDIKIEGLKFDILEKALEQAREGRLYILQKMKKAISEPRKDISPYAPRVVTLHINPEKIPNLIGPSGKHIKSIIDETGVKIDIEQDGIIRVYSKSVADIDRAKELIFDYTREVKEGEIFTGKVVKILDFGAIVELLPGVTGLLHISEIDNKRIKNIADYFGVGDEVLVKVIKIEPDGKVKVSRKAAVYGT